MSFNVELTHHEVDGIPNACDDLPVELSGVIDVSAKVQVFAPRLLLSAPNHKF